MPRGDYRLTVVCADAACRETAFHSYRTKAEYAQGYKDHHGKWKCVRHDGAKEVLGPGNETVVTVLTATPLPWKPEMLTWAQAATGELSSSFETGPGFRAFTGDWPEGTRLEVTARILPPLGAGPPGD